MSVLAVICNSIFTYYQKAHDTTFREEYFSIEIDEKFPRLSDNYEAGYMKKMQYPTLNNEITQIIRKYQKELKGYSVTYLFLTQENVVNAKNVMVTLEKVGEIDMNHLERRIDKSKKKKVTETVSLEIGEKEGIKIPLSICKINENMFSKYDCIYLTYKPLFITYNNKYWFSKTKQNIREENVGNFVIDGYKGGMGSA